MADPKNVFERSKTCNIEWPAYINITEEELKFPLAYVITFFSDPRNLELTLATIFRPHNSYCVHVDNKTDAIVRQTMLNILNCYRMKYPDSYIQPSNRSTAVYWGQFSIVEAELFCLQVRFLIGRIRGNYMV